MNYKYTIALILLFGLGIFSFYSCKYEKLENGSKDALLSLVERNLFLNIENSNLVIKDVEFSTENNEKIKFSKLFSKGEEKLIFYSGLEYCNSCIENQMPFLLWLSNQIGNNNVVIIFNKITRREISLLKKMYNLKCLCLSSQDEIGIMHKNNNLPFFFITNSSLLSKDIFVPLKDKTEYNKRYFRLILKKYWPNIQINDKLLAKP